MRRNRTVTPEERAKSIALKAADDAVRLTDSSTSWWETFWSTYKPALREFQLAELAK